MTDDADNRGPRTDDRGQADDAELLRRYAEEKSDEALGEFVRRHIDFVYAAALRQARGNAPLAQDVVQVVFVDLARKAAAVARHEVVVGWLHTATRFAVAKAIRAESRRTAREQEAFAMNEVLGESDAPVDWERLHPVLDDVLGELKERERAAILLRFFEQKPLAEVGAKLSLTESAARSCVDRALEKMRALLARRGVTSTGAALAVALANQVGIAAPTGLAVSVTGAALMGAAVSTGALAGLVTFMSTSKTLANIASVVVMLAIGVAVFQTRAARGSRADLAVATQERDALRTQLAIAEKRGLQFAGQLASKSQVSNSVPAATKPAGASGNSTAWQPAGPVDHVLDHPEARMAFVQQQILAAKAHFARFFESAGLTADEQNEFLRRVGEQAEAKLDLMASIRAQGYGPNNPPQDPQAYWELMKLDGQAEQEFQGRLHSLLGEERYQQFSAYRNNIPEMNVADQLAGRLYETDAPLTPQQTSDLVRVLRENRYQAAGDATPANTLNGTFVSDEVRQGAMLQSNLQNGSVTFTLAEWQAPVTDSAVARVETVLLPAQLTVLRQLQAQQLARLLLAPLPPTQPDISKLVPKTPGAR